MAGLDHWMNVSLVLFFVLAGQLRFRRRIDGLHKLREIVAFLLVDVVRYGETDVFQLVQVGMGSWVRDCPTLPFPLWRCFARRTTHPNHSPGRTLPARGRSPILQQLNGP